MFIKEVRSKATMVGPGVWEFNAEVAVEDDGKVLYVQASLYDNFKFYGVSEQSVFDCVAGPDDTMPDIMYLEEYKTVRGAAKSRYIDAIKAANKALNMLGNVE